MICTDCDPHEQNEKLINLNPLFTGYLICEKNVNLFDHFSCQICVSDCMKRCFEIPNFWLLTWNATSVCCWFLDVYTPFSGVDILSRHTTVLYNNYLSCNRRNLLTILYLGCVLVCIDASFLCNEYGDMFEIRQWKRNPIYLVMWLVVHWLLEIFRQLFFSLFLNCRKSLIV